MSHHFQLAQINIAYMKGVNIDDPIMKGFTDYLDEINSLAESSEGFVWRLKDENNNATAFDPFDNDRIIINMSVWNDVQSLHQYVYRSFHSSFIKRKKEWFEPFKGAHLALWWIEEGCYPTSEDGKEKIELINERGSSKDAFDFKQLYSATGKPISIK